MYSRLLMQTRMSLWLMSHGTYASVAHHGFTQHAMNLCWINIAFPLRHWIRPCLSLRALGCKNHVERIAGRNTSSASFQDRKCHSTLLMRRKKEIIKVDSVSGKLPFYSHLSQNNMEAGISRESWNIVHLVVLSVILQALQYYSFSFLLWTRKQKNQNF